MWSHTSGGLGLESSGGPGYSDVYGVFVALRLGTIAEEGGFMIILK